MLIRISEHTGILLGIFGIAVLGLIGFPDAQAASMIFTANTTISTDQTILSAEVWTVNPGVILSIDPGVTVIINDGGTITNWGIIDNSGTITVSNSNPYPATGIYIDSNGILSNLSTGIITISSSNGDGISNYGILSNLGSITISNTGGIGIYNGDNFSSSGTITILSSYGDGIVNDGIFSNSGIININNSGDNDADLDPPDSGIVNQNTINNNSGGVITVSNVSGFGISNGINLNFVINNYGTIIVNGTAFDGIVTYGTINNYDAITITSSRIYHNTGDINNSGAITVSPPGVLVNNGKIYNLCGGSYLGPPLNNAMIENCLPCTPPLGDWSVTSSCTMNASATANGNIVIQNGVVLTIPNGVTLNVPSGSTITILSGGGLLIEFGGIVIVIS